MSAPVADATVPTRPAPGARRGVARIGIDRSTVAMRLLATAAYVGTLHLIYVGWVAPLFAYAGFVYTTPEPVEWALAGSLLGAAAVAMPGRMTTPSRFVSWWLFLTLAVPVVLVQIYQPGVSGTATWCFAATTAAATALLGRLDRLPPLRRPRLRVGEQVYVALLLLFSAGTMAWALIALPVQFKLVWLTDISGQRTAFSEAAESMPGLFGYAFRWQSAAVFPALMAFGLARRRHLLLLAGVAGQVVLYGMTGYKQVLLSVVLVPGTYALLRSVRGRSRPDRLLTGSLVVSCWIAAALDRVSGSIDLTSVFVRRAILVAGVYTPQYVEYFGGQGFDNFSHSVLQGFTSSPYAQAPPLTIARAFYDGDFSANANFLVDGFANFGYPGVLAMLAVVAGVLYLVDCLTDRADLAAVAAMLIVPATSLANSAALATVTTHGLGLALVLVAVYPRSRPGEPAPVNP